MTLKISATRPVHLAIPVLLVILILPYVVSPILPIELTITFHLSLSPFPIIHTTIAPDIDPLPVRFVVLELATVLAFVAPVELAVPRLLPVTERPPVVRAIWPAFDSVTVLFVRDPLPFEYSPVCMCVFAQAIRHVVGEASLVHIAFDGD
jgi:hypothetical protein